MGAIVGLAFFVLAFVVGVPVYAFIDWKFSYQKRGESFKEYFEKF